MGTKELSAGARFFEQVSNGRLVEIDRSDITITSIPANKITYVAMTGPAAWISWCLTMLPATAMTTV